MCMHLRRSFFSDNRFCSSCCLLDAGGGRDWTRPPPQPPQAPPPFPRPDPRPLLRPRPLAPRLRRRLRLRPRRRLQRRAPPQRAPQDHRQPASGRPRPQRRPQPRPRRPPRWWSRRRGRLESWRSRRSRWGASCGCSVCCRTILSSKGSTRKSSRRRLCRWFKLCEVRRLYGTP